MRLRPVVVVLACVLVAGLVLPSAASAGPDHAALQVALKALKLYGGPIDGVKGPRTKRALKRFQRRRGLRADGVAGPRTKRALGRRGRPRLGSRVMKRRQRGWDVAGLQYLLRRRGCRPGTIDGGFGRATRRAVRRCQRRYGLRADGLAGRSTLRALRSGPPRRRSPRRHRHASRGPSGPVRFLRPIPVRATDGFGMRWGRPHQGLDFPAPHGAVVGAAGVGVVEFTGWMTGYGNVVVVRHRLGWTTLYAHLSAFLARPGQAVSGGVPIGRVGTTGNSTGPHLHFETRRFGRPYDPLPRLLN